MWYSYKKQKRNPWEGSKRALCKVSHEQNLITFTSPSLFPLLYFISPWRLKEQYVFEFGNQPWEFTSIHCHIMFALDESKKYNIYIWICVGAICWSCLSTADTLCTSCCSVYISVFWEVVFDLEWFFFQTPRIKGYGSQKVLRKVQQSHFLGVFNQFPSCIRLKQCKSLSQIVFFLLF